MPIPAVGWNLPAFLRREDERMGPLSADLDQVGSIGA